MARFFWTRARAVAAATALIAALALPAAADARQSAPAPPGGDDIEMLGGTPAVAYAAPDGVHVSSLTKNGKRWQQLGATIRHAADAPVYDVDLAVDPGGRPWVTWTETDATGTRQARVARFDGRHWREVVGGAQPLNEVFDPQYGYPPLGAYDPQLAFAGGRVWVVYVQDSISDYVMGWRRLASDGSHWEHLNGIGLVRPAGPHVAVVNGQLFAGVSDVLIPTGVVWRYDPARDFFARLSEPNLPDTGYLHDVSSLGGRVTVLQTLSDGRVEVVTLTAGDTWQPLGSPLATGVDLTPDAGQALEGRFAAWIEDGKLRLAEFRGGDWRPRGVAGAGAVTAAGLVSGRGGTWLLWRDAGGAHVARLAQA